MRNLERTVWIPANNILLIFFLLFLFSLLVNTSLAQYQVYYWANFEDGKLPAGSTPLGEFFQKTVSVVDFNLVSGMPPVFRSGIAGSETGRYGLLLKVAPEVWISGLATGVILNRDALGRAGRALFQADFFLPPSNEILPSLAVLAMEPLPPGEHTPQSFYRFGITLNKMVYFSHVIMSEPTARVFKFDTQFPKTLPRPGWHRFAIVFEGTSRIRCYVDGFEPRFSPLEEPSLRKLQVGIMLADKKNTYQCFVDNLSIQWTPQDVPLPDSPYASSWRTSAPGLTLRPTPLPVGGASSFVWLDYRTAFTKSPYVNTQRLLYFQAPRLQITRQLEKIFATNPSAQSFLRKYTLVKIDVNQLQGGTLAQQYSVFKVPTLILIDQTGRETARAIVGKLDNWESILAKLKTK
ncbi:thioredoxin family protein [Candidatus Sumerlaeota bacterium]|nr:thioredoxin family protein [Candidatus Sumerlaeota bacterium]